MYSDFADASRRAYPHLYPNLDNRPARDYVLKLKPVGNVEVSSSGKDRSI